jgi:hypothetical protein
MNASILMLQKEWKVRQGVLGPQLPVPPFVHYEFSALFSIIGATGMVEGLALVTADRVIRNSRALPTIW